MNKSITLEMFEWDFSCQKNGMETIKLYNAFFLISRRIFSVKKELKVSMTYILYYLKCCSIYIPEYSHKWNDVIKI